MEPRRGEAGSEDLTELQKARLDRLAERIKALPQDRREVLMDSLRGRQAFTLGEAADLLGCHKETLRRAIKKGELKAAKIGRDYRVGKPDLEQYFQDMGGGKLFDDR